VKVFSLQERPAGLGDFSCATIGKREVSLFVLASRNSLSGLFAKVALSTKYSPSWLGLMALVVEFSIFFVASGFPFT